MSGAVPERLATLGWTPLGARRAALLAGAALTAAALALFARLRNAAAVAHVEQGRRDDRVAPAGWSDARLALVTAAVFVWMLAAALTLPFFNLYFARSHGLSLTAAGALLGAGQVITALALFLSAEIAHRGGPGAALWFWTLVLPPALALLALGPGLVPAAVLFMVQGFAAPATYPLVDQLVLSRVAPERRGRAASWRSTATEASGVVGAALGGALLAAASFSTLFAAAAATALAGSLALLTAFRARAAERAAATPRVPPPAASPPT